MKLTKSQTEKLADYTIGATQVSLPRVYGKYAYATIIRDSKTTGRRYADRIEVGKRGAVEFEKTERVW